MQGLLVRSVENRGDCRGFASGRRSGFNEGMATGESPTCRQCGYDFTGLKAKGVCPECGNYYNMDTGAGLRQPEEDAARKTTFLVRRVRTILLAVGAVVVMVCAGLASAVAQVPAKPLWVGAFVAGVLVLGAFTSYAYERED
jgi:hypothetical protein